MTLSPATRLGRHVSMLVLLTTWAGAAGAADVARVRQGSTEWTIESLIGTTRIPSVYRYGNPNPACANTGLEVEGTSLLFLYNDPVVIGPSPSALALVIIHDAPG